MIKCCQNCHYFRKSTETCESGELVLAWEPPQIDRGSIRMALRNAGYDYDLDDAVRAIDALIDRELGNCDDAVVHIKDAQNFCCNAWR